MDVAWKTLQSILKSNTFNMMGRSSDDCEESSLGPGPDTTNCFNSLSYKPSGLLNVQAACRRRPVA